MSTTRLDVIRGMAQDQGDKVSQTRAELESSVLELYSWASSAQLGFAFVLSKKLQCNIPLRQMADTRSASLWLSTAERKTR